MSTGLSREQIRRLRSEYSPYIVDSGRICVAAKNRTYLPYVCESIASVLR